jgi:hypothetical protein
MQLAGLQPPAGELGVPGPKGDPQCEPRFLLSRL